MLITFRNNYLLTHALGSELDEDVSLLFIDFVSSLYDYSPDAKNLKKRGVVKNNASKGANIPFTLFGGQTDKIKIRKDFNMDDAVILISNLFVFILSKKERTANDLFASSIQSGTLKKILFNNNNLADLARLSKSNPNILKIRFVCSEPDASAMINDEIFIVLKSEMTLQNFWQYHWKWFQREYLNFNHLKKLRKESPDNCSFNYKNVQILVADNKDVIGEIVVKLTADYVDSRGNTNADRELLGTISNM